MLPAQIRQAEKKAAAAKKRKETAKAKSKRLLDAVKKRNKRKQASTIPALIAQQNKQIAHKALNEANAVAQSLKSDQTNQQPPTNYELALVQLDVHLKNLKGKSLEEKIKLKTEYIPKYMTFLADYREKGVPYPNEVLASVIVWMADCEMFEEVFDWGDFAVSQGQESPKVFKTDLPTMLARTLFAWSEKQFKEGQSAEPYFTELLKRVDTKQWLVGNTIIEGYIYKLAGQMADKTEDYASAVKWYERCMAVNPKTDTSGGGGAISLLNAAQAKLQKQQ